MQARRTAPAIGAMVVATALWGATFVITRDSVDRIAPATLVGARFACAAIVFGLIALIGRRPIDRTTLWAGVVTAVPTACSYWFQAIGLTEIRAGSSAFLTCAGTLFAGLFAWPLLRQRPSGSLLGGMALAGLGSLLLAEQANLRLGRGDLWTLAGALVYALQIVAIGRWSDRVDPVSLLAVQSAGAALILLPWRPLPAAGVLEAADLWRIGYLVVAGTCVAPFLQVFAQGVLPAGRVAMLFALEPVFGLLVALGLGGERFAGRWWLGAALIVCAVTWVEWRAEAARRRSLPPSG